LVVQEQIRISFKTRVAHFPHPKHYQDLELHLCDYQEPGDVLYITRLLLLCFGDRGNPAQSLGSDPERDRLFSSLGLCYDAVPLWRFICGSEMT